jgi:type I restriction enzyme S subunit
MRSIPIPLPPLAEQQRIVAKLDAAFAEIDRAAALTESKLTEAKNLLDASIAKIFDDNLIGADYFVLDDVVTRLTNGYVGATKNIYQEEGIPYLLARHVKNNTLKFDGKTFVSNEFNVKNKKSILKQDDVLLVQSGHIGHTAVVPMEHEGHNCHAMIVISTVKEALTGEYLSALFNSREYKAKLLSLRTGSTVPHLNCGDVNKVKIPIPNMKTQETIISLTKSATASFAAMEVSLLSKSSGLKKLKSAILAQELQPPHSEAA